MQAKVSVVGGYSTTLDVNILGLRLSGGCSENHLISSLHCVVSQERLVVVDVHHSSACKRSFLEDSSHEEAVCLLQEFVKLYENWLRVAADFVFAISSSNISRACTPFHHSKLRAYRHTVV